MTQHSPGRIEAIIERDGDKCWLCNRPLDDDLTIEHLIAKKYGGGSAYENLALCHAQCNNILGHKSLDRKMEMRDQVHEFEATVDPRKSITHMIKRVALGWFTVEYQPEMPPTTMADIWPHE